MDTIGLRNMDQTIFQNFNIRALQDFSGNILNKMTLVAF